MQIGINKLGLAPQDFWRLSLKEFLTLTDTAQTIKPMTHKEMETLIENSGEK